MSGDKAEISRTSEGRTKGAPGTKREPSKLDPFEKEVLAVIRSNFALGMVRNQCHLLALSQLEKERPEDRPKKLQTLLIHARDRLDRQDRKVISALARSSGKVSWTQAVQTHGVDLRKRGDRKAPLDVSSANRAVAFLIKRYAVAIREQPLSPPATPGRAQLIDPARFVTEGKRFVPICRWNLARPLTEEGHEIWDDLAPDFSAWVDPGEHERQREVARAEGYAGTVPYLTRYQIDYREGPENEKFRMWVARADYSSYVATIECQKKDRRRRDAYRRAVLAAGPPGIPNPPPSAIWVTVTVQTGMQFLAILRSMSVVYERNEWVPGGNEAMKRPCPHELAEKSQPFDENLFALARRCLRQEVGLEREDHGDIIFSWIGYDLRWAGVQVIAHTRTRLRPSELVVRVMNDEDAEEHCHVPSS